MKTFGKIWVFYDKKKKKKSKALDLVQAQSIILGLMSKEPERYCLWTPGWNEWVPLNKFLQTEQKYFMITPEASKVVENIEELTIQSKKIEDDDRTIALNSITASITDTITEMIYTKVAAELPPQPVNGDYGFYHPDFKADQIDLKIKVPNFNPESKNESDRRTEVRHNFKMEIIVVSKKGKTFKTFSDNLSLGGTLLQDPLPRDFLNAPFDLIFVNRFEKDPKKSRLYFNGKVVGDFRDPKRLMFLNPEPKTLQQLESMITAYLSYQESMQKKSG